MIKKWKFFKSETTAIILCDIYDVSIFLDLYIVHQYCDLCIEIKRRLSNSPNVHVIDSKCA